MRGKLWRIVDVVVVGIMVVVLLAGCGGGDFAFGLVVVDRNLAYDVSETVCWD